MAEEDDDGGEKKKTSRVDFRTHVSFSRLLLYFTDGPFTDKLVIGIKTEERNCLKQLQDR